MPLIIGTNIEALNAQRNLSRSQSDLSVSLQRLSSGFRINSAKDDAAGLAISERLGTQVRGLNQAIRNANDGISLSQTAEGALGETTSLLQRMRELAVQAANDTNSAVDRAALQGEVNLLRNELDRIASTTSFNGVKLLDGTFTNKIFQIGANTNENISLSFSGTSSATIGSNAVNSNTAAGSISVAIAAAATVVGVNNNVAAQTLTITGNLGSASSGLLGAGSTAKAIADAVNAQQAATGVSATARTEATLSSVGSAGTVTFDLYGSNTSAVSISANVVSVSDLKPLADVINNYTATTGITAVSNGATLSLTSAQGYDIAIENWNNSGATKTVNFAGQDGAAATLTGGAATDSSRVGGRVSLSSSNNFSVTTDVGTTLLSAATVAATLSSVASISIASQAGANSAIAVLDGALDSINSSRSTLGATQSRFEATIRNLQTTSENLSAAGSRIKDADYAVETARLSRAQILQQAGIQILATAKDLPQAALTLLR